MGIHDLSDKHPDRASSSRRLRAVERLRRIRRERHTRRLVAAGLITAITTGVVLATATGQTAEARSERAADAIHSAPTAWPVDTVLDEIAVQREAARSAVEAGVAAEAQKRALDEAEAQAEAEAEAEREAAEAAAAAAAEEPHWVTPSDDEISSYFGERWGRMHQGLDFANEDGEPNLAIGDGTVTYAGWMSGYGNLVVIDHGGGIETAYGHADEILVSVGEDVDPGEKISLTGDTGRSTGPHLHFEVRIHGEQVDPLPWLEDHGIVPPESDKE